ncbi:hypothetical protein CVD28_01480 [Bacillus sp. M6-12]|uniref:hypothetical protein n=1 Tax=Bacillus sp. M6-12 TaxID=2054166 RepID=UPI000C7795AD|nr:hypothetical protein [Bacillus sp. M6-12]PLS19106.1 hypothetical protein CVD28_01480 [Bacillus sp. M6-12]
MIYIQALELLNVAVKHDLVGERDGKVIVYRKGTSQSNEGFYLEEKDTVAKELMKDEKGQTTLIQALKEKGVDFVPTDYSTSLGIIQDMIK